MATFLYPSTPISIPGVATEATLLLVEQNTQDTVTELQTLNANVATETTLAALAAEDFATQTTLASLNSKVTAVNTGAVVVASSALPTGASTEATLSALNAKVTAVDTDDVTITSSALPTGAATETSLAAAASDLADLNARIAGSLAPVAYDEIVQTYVGATERINTVTYKLATVTVKVLTFSYDGSDRLTGVVAS